MSYVTDVNGIMYPVSQIRKVRRGAFKDGDFTSREDGQVLLTDEMLAVTVTDDEILSMIRSSNPVIGSQPGFGVLSFWDSPEPFIELEPIIGWRIDNDSTAEPIVSDPTFEGINGRNAILRPDGTAVDLFGTVYESRGAWEAAMKKQADEDRLKVSAPAPSPRT